MTLRFLLARRVPPPRAHTALAPAPRAPPLLCSPAAHTQQRQEERGRRGPPPSSSSVSEGGRARSRYGIPHGTGGDGEGGAGGREGQRSFSARSDSSPRGAERRERRVSGRAASRLTASKQPFLKANCNPLSAPPARSAAPPSPPPALLGAVPRPSL